MKKPTPKQKKSIQASKSTQKGSGQDNSPTPQATKQILKIEKKLDTKLKFGTAWKGFWAYVGPTLTLIGLYSYWTPSITITSGVNLDPSQKLQTQFVISNTGHVSVYNIVFACSVIGNHIGIDDLEANGSLMTSISVLAPKNSGSRGCFSKSFTTSGIYLKIEAKYTWPLVGRESTEIAYFSVRDGATGSFLVPDVLPDPAMPAFVRFGFPPD